MGSIYRNVTFGRHIVVLIIVVELQGTVNNIRVGMFMNNFLTIFSFSSSSCALFAVKPKNNIFAPSPACCFTLFENMTATSVFEFCHRIQ